MPAIKNTHGLMIWLCVLLLLSTAGIQVQADEDTYLMYYEDENPNRLDYILLQENICIEAVLRLNPDLDMNNIAYGDSFYIPTDEPCYQYSETNFGGVVDGNPPRLKYYEDGQWLDEPYYSNEVVYLLTYQLPASLILARETPAFRHGEVSAFSFHIRVSVRFVQHGTVCIANSFYQPIRGSDIETACCSASHPPAMRPRFFACFNDCFHHVARLEAKMPFLTQPIA
jgi:hypothetical protein